LTGNTSNSLTCARQLVVDLEFARRLGFPGCIRPPLPIGPLPP